MARKDAMSNAWVTACTPRLTDEPTGYLQWHAWAERKAIAHRQLKCAKCGLWHLWERKPKK